MVDYPLLSPGDFPGINIDKPVSSPSKYLIRYLYEDCYQRKFAEQSHVNWIISEPNNHYSVVSVLLQPESTKMETVNREGKENFEGIDLDWSFCTQQTHHALWTRSKGYKEFKIVIPVSVLEESTNLSTKICSALASQIEFPIKCEIFLHGEFVEEFRKFEAKYPQKCVEMKIAVLYVRGNQETPEEWASNGRGEDRVDDKFWKLMDVFGKKIALDTWKGFRGEMGMEGETYYDLWDPEDNHGEVQVIYHLSCMLDADEDRRLIGNDVAVIIYVEEGSQFSPKNVALLGKVHQVFALVQPIGKKWRTSFFSTKNLPKFNPPPPKYLVDLPTLKKCVLTKLYNGISITRYCPPLDKFFVRPREFALKSILQKHVTEREGCSCGCS
eukprot:TRINITY_DN2204_c0_g1_i29.p1 TRINITY_DN2204_c0_g1~~TRINITY_DN2204_c0_g1_i29.p1  ORF type:complete len:384 (+),score=80.31 TRINITY_DN2204_c0_g1_i29:217-1368(+)